MAVFKVAGRLHTEPLATFNLGLAVEADKITLSSDDYRDFINNRILPDLARALLAKAGLVRVEDRDGFVDPLTELLKNNDYLCASLADLYYSDPDRAVPEVLSRQYPETAPAKQKPSAQEQIQAVLAERGNVHGEFELNSEWAVRLVEAIMAGNTSRREKLEFYQLNALIMIAQKMSRILAGDPTHEDHWVDIQGYARLAQNINAERKNFPF